MHLVANCLRNSIRFEQAKRFLNNESKQYFDCFDPLLKTTWSTKISIPFLSSLDNLHLDAYIIFLSADNFEIEHNHANFWFGVQYFLITNIISLSLYLNDRPAIFFP